MRNQLNNVQYFFYLKSVRILYMPLSVKDSTLLVLLKINIIKVRLRNAGQTPSILLR